jgi:hypothetical protein
VRLPKKQFETATETLEAPLQAEGSHSWEIPVAVTPGPDQDEG